MVVLDKAHSSIKLENSLSSRSASPPRQKQTASDSKSDTGTASSIRSIFGREKKIKNQGKIKNKHNLSSSTVTESQDAQLFRSAPSGI